MAAPEKTVIAAAGAVCTIFSNPEAALWNIAAIPMSHVFILSNNNHDMRVRRQSKFLRGEESYAGKARFNGSALSPRPTLP